MKLFCKHSICSECGVAFKPRRDAYDYLCLPHATPKLVIDRRRGAVKEWAGVNWERLEPEMLKEQEERHKAMNKMLQESMKFQQQSMAQSGQAAGNPLGNLFGLF
jgi:hypothetical protein